jgi:hypothetical protein
MAGQQAGVQGRHHRGLLIVAVGGFWFFPATHINAWCTKERVSPPWAFVAFLAGVCIDRDGADVSGDHRQSLHDRAGPTAVRGHAHQPRAVLQRGRLDFRARLSAACFSIPRTPRAVSTGSQTLYIPYFGDRCRGRAGRDLLLRQRSRYQDRGRLSPGRFSPAVPTPSGRTRTSPWRWPRSSSTSPPRPASSASSSTT